MSLIMIEQLFQILDGYSRIFDRFPTMPIYWDSKTHRFCGVTKLKTLTGWICSIIILLIVAVLPVLTHAGYLILRTLQLGHYPSKAEEPLASPKHVLAVAVTTLGGGGSIIMSGIMVLFNTQIMNGLTAIWDVHGYLYKRKLAAILFYKKVMHHSHTVSIA